MPSGSSRRSRRASSTASSPGDPGVALGAGALRELAARHGIRPRKALGQHFLIDPNLARAIVADAGVGPGDRVLEVGAGLGSLTVALAEAAAEVVAVETDRAVAAALRDVVAGRPNVRVVEGDALRIDWASELPGGPWRMVSNLPYNVAAPILFRMLDEAPRVTEYLVMVQREVGERLAAAPGSPAYGGATARLAYLADVSVVRRVPPTVFWPAPAVESVLVRIVPREPPVAAPREAVFRVVEAGFAQRRKTMRNALVRLGLEPDRAVSALRECGLADDVRAEDLALSDFACIAEALERLGA
jgi:16S rRNA (adenine1518-N6/adenine1519-N6)-dimethyltransferase